MHDVIASEIAPHLPVSNQKNPLFIIFPQDIACLFSITNSVELFGILGRVRDYKATCSKYDMGHIIY